MNSLNDIWSEIIKILSEELSPTTINTWFLDCTPVELDDCKLVLHTPSEFKKGILNERFLPQIKKALYNLFSTEFEVVILCSEAEMRAYTDQKRRDNELPEIAGYTFDRFVVGPSNKFAHAAAEAVANNDGITYNPLLIYGNSGLGKTHLLLSIGATIHDRYPSKKIVYIKGDQFTNELIKSIREGTAEEFRTKYRNADLFLIDDIQFIAGKPQTQEEFFHTFNNIYEAGHQIVITSDRPPKDMAALDDRLRTRFEGGLLADIEPPDYETRVAIIKNKAAQFGLIISEEAVNYIADNVKANIRQLEGVIKKLTAYKAILNTEIDLEAVKRAIADVIKNEDYIPQPKKIIQETAKFFNVSEEDLIGKNQSKKCSQPRQISMYLIRTLTNLSLQDIGKEFSGRNHATVLTSIRNVEDMSRKDTELMNIIRDITANINSPE